MDIIDSALILAGLGLKIIPVAPRDKNPILFRWQELATSDIPTICDWFLRNDQINFGVVGHPDSLCILDCDNPELLERIERETGEKFPDTFMVDSSKPGRWHAYFIPTGLSRKAGNANLPGWYQLQASRKQVVGPWCVHPTGAIYTPRTWPPVLAPMPDWLAAWVVSNKSPDEPSMPRKSRGDMSELHEDFDFEALCEHYGWAIKEVAGFFHHVEICPIKGGPHASGRPAIYFDGNSLGWSSFADNCECHNTRDNPGMTFGMLLKHMHDSGHEPYPGPIWATWEEGGGEWDATGVTILGTAGKQMLKEATGDSVSEETWYDEEDKAHVALPHEVASHGGMAMFAKPFSDVSIERVEWVWPGRFPANCVIILAGQPGGGKSLLSTEVAAIISTGRDWPDGTKNSMPPSKVLLVASEDDAASVIKPRLLAAGADMSKVLVHEHNKGIDPPIITKHGKAIVQKEPVKRGLNLSQDISLLADAKKNIPDLAVIIIDPVTGVFGVKVTEDNELRPVMNRLKEMCETSKLTIIAIAHMNKRAELGGLQRILGASSFTAVARAIWIISKDPEDPTLRHLALAKLNVGAEVGGMMFRVGTETVTDRDGTTVDTAMIGWEGTTEETADSLIERSRQSKAERKNADILAWVQERLKDGPKDALETHKAAIAAGFSRSALIRAREDLGVVSKPYPLAEQDQRGGKARLWSIPPKPKPEEKIPYKDEPM